MVCMVYGVCIGIYCMYCIDGMHGIWSMYCMHGIYGMYGIYCMNGMWGVYDMHGMYAMYCIVNTVYVCMYWYNTVCILCICLDIYLS
jgi:hypothetical protein